MILRLPPRLREDSQAGFGIIEVLVSAILVVMVATGVFAAFDTATRASGANKARSIASNVARGDQELLRGKTADELAVLAPTRTENVDGRTFTVASSTEWVADRTGTPSCTTADGRADYLKLRSQVTWGGIGSSPPVVMESLRAIPRGEFRPNQGTIAIKVVDRNGAGVSGMTVAITGTRVYNGTTNSLGCLLIDQVPVGPYSASISGTGYVEDKNDNDAVVVKAFQVAKEQTSSETVTMDRAGTMRADYKSTASTAAGAAETATTGEGFTVAHTGLVSPTFRSFTLPTATAVRSPLWSGAGTTALATSATRTLFPFVTGYQVWAGACNEAWPGRYGQPVTTQLISPGALVGTEVKVREPRMEINVRRYSTAAQVSTATTNVTSQRVTLTPVVASCVNRATSVNTDANGIAAFTLPYGEYNVCAQDSTSTTSARRRRNVVRVNEVAGGRRFDALYNGGAAEPVNGAIILPFNASATPGAAC